MHILSLNAGSATLKFGVFDPASATPLMEATIEHPAVDAAAFDEIERRLRHAGMPAIDAVGHRVAHGGPRLSEAALVDADTEREIDQAAPLAPQHNPVALAGIRLARERWPGLPQVAVFDTAFHAGMPEEASLYAVPQAWRDAGVRRYGFHGLSHRHVLEAVSGALDRAPEDLRIISCHLGNGASVCAIDRGRSIDTSMGMTALEGLVMGTRSGDLDPGVQAFVARRLGLDPAQIEAALYHDSGLKALSGIGADLREIEARARQGHAGARTALQVHAYRVRKYIGAYAAAMGGCDAVAFTGGAGENSAALRRRILEGLQFLGVRLDEDRNESFGASGAAVAELQAPRSQVAVLAVRSREQWVIARETAAVLRRAERAAARQDFSMPVAISAHHVHLTQAAVEALFGTGHALRVLQPLSQPGFFAAEETVSVIGERGRLERVRVVGPCRAANQIEVSRTEAIRLGIEAPLRLSGDLAGSAEVTLTGPAGTLRTTGLIVARRHLHLTSADARRLGVQDRGEIEVALDTPRGTVLRHVALRVDDGAVLELHLDTDEANAAGLRGAGEGVLQRSGCKARVCGGADHENHASCEAH
ncbi:acetate/propionate family kinase [Ideonella alba]|mgnify:FL=1|uniref:Acetate kinase n=1 Tax=Ideonella alba TaxID=2824118 RepID=A0A941BMS4_9BURK|nr:acetate/propionate family kinase [Ideonella alba]MBQ0932569.1 acetate/propionate family kinase [Ideonella alba]